MTEKAHETLYRAADLLEQRASKTTEGPWRAHDTYLNHGGYTATVLAGEGNDVRLIAWLPTMNHQPWGSERNVWNDSRWIALMSPAVAAPLVEWLRATAKYAWTPKGLESNAAEDVLVEPALAFARMVLGEATEAAGIPVVVHRED